MKLGFVSAILPELSCGEVLNTARKLGYDCVELMCWPHGKADRRYAGVTHVDVENLDAGRADNLLQQAHSHGVTISGLGYYPNPLSTDPETAAGVIEHLKHVIRAAARLGVNQVNTFAGRDRTKSIDDNWPRLLEVWKPLIQLAEDQGVRIGIENCPMFFTHDEWPGGNNLAVSPAVWRRLFNDLASENLGLNYDPSHLVWQQMDPIAPLHEFADRIFHVHAKDVRIDRARLNDVGILATPLEYHAPVLPGRGEIDWKKFFATLHQIGYDGPVCVEVEDRDFEHSLEGRRLALRKSLAFLRPFLQQPSPSEIPAR